MSTYVLVHGGDCSTESWNKLAPLSVQTGNNRMGYRVWSSIAAILEARGHSVIYPSLIDEFEANLTGHIEQICAILRNHPEKVILAGHSYGGMIITGVACHMPEKVAGLVFFDAALPEPGQSLYDVIREASHDPDMIRGLEPAPAYTEKLLFEPSLTDNIPKLYVKCRQSEVLPVVNHVMAKFVCAVKNWSTAELGCGHIFQATHYAEAASLLLDFGAQIQG